jgi:alcohol dehydrogenase class IV
VVATSIQFYLNAKGGWKQQAQVDQNTTLTVDEALVDQIKNMDFDNIIALGKGLDKLEGQ